jgi:ABC-type sugar transport system ATPase subunit
MGKTGCGKTTILEAICGLKPVKSGRILLDGRDATQLSPGSRNIGFVPQDGAIFQTMSVYDNIAFGLSIRHWQASAIQTRVQELSELLGVSHLLSRQPRHLSGGESQRVALGRALAANPSILCLDEPLSALDEDTREEIYELLQTVKQHTDVTILHITHNKSEAFALADCFFLMEDGFVRPANLTPKNNSFVVTSSLSV